MSNFLAGCMQKYGCQFLFGQNPVYGGGGSSDINTIPPGYIYSPFVSLKCVVNGQRDRAELLSVGNKSLPADGPNRGKRNTAVIKSMDYGTQGNGMGVEIEIVDEEGGTFETFFSSLSKSVEDAPMKIRNFELDFGWIIQNCDGTNAGKIAVSTVGAMPDKFIYLNPLQMQVSYEGGKIKYSIKANDGLGQVTETRAECNIGTEDKKIPLKQAIRQLCESREPGPKCSVEFLSADKKSELKFRKKDNGDNGPKNVWTANQQNKLAVIRRWLSAMVTENNKGIIINWKGDKPPTEDSCGTIVIMESAGDSLCQQLDPCINNISNVTSNPGTYIVNGGAKTSVINFSPSFSFPLVNIGKSGGAQSSMDGGGAKQKGMPQCSDKRSSAGAATFTPTGSNDSNMWDPGEATKNRSNADATNQQANAFREIPNSIEAELKIFGDPSLVSPVLIGSGQYTISLIVINPFHLKKGAQDCPDWLAKPLCNNTLSNKRWMIMGVNHQIKEGSFITTLKLRLDAPNSDLNPGDPLGGVGSGGPTENIKTQPDPAKCQ